MGAHIALMLEAQLSCIEPRALASAGYTIIVSDGFVENSQGPVKPRVVNMGMGLGCRYLMYGDTYYTRTRLCNNIYVSALVSLTQYKTIIQSPYTS